MRVTVEGVETSQQVDFLYDADADQVQGFYFGKPVPAAEVSADILEDFRKAHAPGEVSRRQAAVSGRTERRAPRPRPSATGEGRAVALA